MQFTDKLEKQPRQTVKIIATLPWDEIETAKKAALTEMVKTTEVEGFRKGKAPEKIVAEKLGEEKILEHASRHFLSALYSELIKKHDLKPFFEPRVKIMKAPKGGEWEIVFEIALEPLITKLADYKKIAGELKAEAKKEEIWVPGKESPNATKTDSKTLEEKKNQRMQTIFNSLIEKSTLEISPFIIEEEINRRLVNLYEEIKKLGLTVEQYLQTKKETIDSLRSKIEHEVTDIYKSEFILDKIADLEKIVVEEADLEKIIATAKTTEEKEVFSKNRYFYSRILRKQKTLDFLATL